jgi:hypothetical protein
MLDNPISRKPVWAWLWIYLLLRANWSETEIIWNDKKQIIAKGSFITGRNSLAIETGIPASTIEDILKYLETQQQIRQQKNNKYRVITIVNWERYQKSDNKSDNKATSRRHLADTDKNNNKDNKDKKSTIAETSSAETPFSLQSAIQSLYDSPRRDLNVIALYLEERKPNIESKEQLSTVIKRHLRPAQALSPFSDDQILNAIPRAKSMTSEWTIETLIKIVSK